MTRSPLRSMLRRAATTATSATATTTRSLPSRGVPFQPAHRLTHSLRREEWQKQVARGPRLHEFLQRDADGHDQDAATSHVEDDALSEERPTKEQSLQQIRDLLHEIRASAAASPAPSRTTMPDPTLVDNYGRVHTYLRISLTERCNLRCRYCMPADGVELQPMEDLLATDEIVRLARLFAAAGVTRIRLTGGEPLLRRDLVDLVAQLRAIEGITSVGITTNGIVLQKKLAALQAAGLDRINVSLDTLQPDKFTQITRRQGFHRVLAAIEEAQTRGFAPLKLNCVVMRDFNLDELLDFVAFTEHHAVDVRFIEWMPFDSNRWNDTTFVSFHEMMTHIQHEYPSITKLEDGAHDTSKAYAIPGHRGQFGFITSMSEHFCGSCNRLRLTADGNLKVCLFGNTEVSLRDALRHSELSELDMQDLIAAAVRRKKFALGGHGDMYGLAKAKNRPMILIGG